MLKVIITLALTMLVNNAWADYIRAEGKGNNFVEARNEAFSRAIDTYVGTVVVTEREMHNYKLAKNDILVYSSGYVDDYKVISYQEVNNKVFLVLDVSVSANKIANRILGKFESNEVVDGNKVQSVVDSYSHERTSADKLLQNVLNDYPYRAFNLEQYPYSVVTTNYRDMQLVMPYKLSWNYNYLKSLGDVAQKIQDTKSKFLRRANSNFIISAKAPDDLVFGKMTKYEFNDLTYPNKISSALYDREVRIMGRLINKNNETIWYICHHPKFLSGQGSTFYGIGDVLNLNIYGNSVEKGEVRLDISPKLYTMLPDVTKIQLQIVKQTDC